MKAIALEGFGRPVVLTMGVKLHNGTQLVGVFADEYDATSDDADGKALAIISSDTLTAEQVGVAIHNSELG